MFTFSLRRHSFLGAAIAVGLVGLMAHSARAQYTNAIVAIGDSYAFGYTSSGTTPTNNGDNGYVAGLADFLDTINGAAPRPTVLSTARPGETTGSFASDTSANFNTNYAAGGFTQTQQQLLGAVNAMLPAPPKWITYQMGGNDILGLFITPGFSSLTFSAQQAFVDTTLDNIDAFNTLALSQIRAAAPNSQIFMLDYPDPFAGLGSGFPEPIAAYASTQTRDRFAAVAANPLIDATFIDLYGPFVGKELTHTNITTIDQGFPNFHPNAAGYSLISSLVIATVPEPGTIGLVALGVLALPFVARRRKTV